MERQGSVVGKRMIGPRTGSNSWHFGRLSTVPARFKSFSDSSYGDKRERLYRLYRLYRLNVGEDANLQDLKTLSTSNKTNNVKERLHG